MTQNLSERGPHGNRSIELPDMNDIKLWISLELLISS